MTNTNVDIRKVLEELAALAKDRFDSVESVLLADEGLVLNVRRQDEGLHYLLEGYLAATGLAYRLSPRGDQVIVQFETELREVPPETNYVFQVLYYDDFEDCWVKCEKRGKPFEIVDIDELGTQGWRPVHVLAEQYSEGSWAMVLWQREISPNFSTTIAKTLEKALIR